MILHHVAQGSPEWVKLRIGLPTASCFDRILTPKTRKLSASADKYALELCTEWLFGRPVHDVATAFMERGSELEAQARATYSFDYTSEVDEVGGKIEQIGFITDDTARYGCSPDALVGPYGLLEIKCLSAVNHVAALLGDADSYTLQIQGQLLVAERSWCDRMYFNPVLPSIVQRVERDEELIGQLADTLDSFCDRLTEMKNRLLALGCKPVDGAVPDAVPAAESAEFDVSMGQCVDD